MTPAQEILKLIESVDPNDSAKMDEIDYLVWQYTNSPMGIRQYTRSRDALKAIRPEGWMTLEHGQDMVTGVWYTTLINLDHGGKNAKHSGEQSTEELAELHAIIQAIEHERTRG